jgi:hypothetical protein
MRRGNQITPRARYNLASQDGDRLAQALRTLVRSRHSSEVTIAHSVLALRSPFRVLARAQQESIVILITRVHRRCL